MEQLLGGRNRGIALSARETLKRVAADDDSRKVSTFASEILERSAEVAAPKKEEEAERKRTKVANLNQEAQAAEDKEDWATVIEKRKGLLALEPAHSESIFKLSYAQTQQELAAVYAEGQKFHAANDWSQALSCFELVQDLKVDYKDVINLITDVQRKIAEEVKPDPQPTAAPPPVELTTPASQDSLEPAHQPEMFSGYTLVEQTRKSWPIAIGAGILLVLGIGILVYNSSGSNPLPSAASSTASPSPSAQPDIKKVDFNKLTYSVFDDKYKTPQSSNMLYPIGIAYGDLTGDGIDEAAFVVSQSDTQGSYYDDVQHGFLYTMRDGEPALLDKFFCPVNGETLDGRPANAADLNMVDVEIEGRKLVIKCWEVGAYETTVRFDDVTTFEWNGSKLVQIGRTVRRPN